MDLVIEQSCTVTRTKLFKLSIFYYTSTIMLKPIDKIPVTNFTYSCSLLNDIQMDFTEDWVRLEVLLDEADIDCRSALGIFIFICLEQIRLSQACRFEAFKSTK